MPLSHYLYQDHLRGKKWFGIAAEKTRRGMWLKMDKKDYHCEANWKWKQYLCGHTHLNCNGIFSMGTPSFISLFICSANINGCLASAKHSSRAPRHSDEKDKQGHCLCGAYILESHGTNHLNSSPSLSFCIYKMWIISQNRKGIQINKLWMHKICKPIANAKYIKYELFLPFPFSIPASCFKSGCKNLKDTSYF